MLFVVTIPAAVTIGTTLYNADQNRKAQNQANGASAENKALTQQQFDEDKRRYDLNREDQERWGMMQINGEEEFDRRNRADKEMAYQRGAALNQTNVNNGNLAGNQLSYLMGLGGTGAGVAGSLAKNFTNADFVKDPGYEFRMAEGERGQNNSLAAQGGLLSGAAMKALERYRQGFASSEFDKAYARFDNDKNSTYSKLSGIQAAGQNAINSTNGLGGTVQGNAGNGASNVASGLNSANAQFGQSSNNYYNNLRDSNTANANTNAAAGLSQSRNIVNGLNSIYNGWQQNDVVNQIQGRNRTNNQNSLTYINDWVDL